MENVKSFPEIKFKIAKKNEEEIRKCLAIFPFSKWL